MLLEPEVSTSVGKSNFWTNAQQLFGLSQPLPDHIGLMGKGLAGSIDRKGDHFEAVGIPLTEYSDSAPTVPPVDDSRATSATISTCQG